MNAFDFSKTLRDVIDSFVNWHVAENGVEKELTQEQFQEEFLSWLDKGRPETKINSLEKQ